MKYRNIFNTLVLALLLLSNQMIFAGTEPLEKAANPFDPIENLKKLGTDEFTPDAWARAGQEERGRMIWSFFQQYDLSELTLDRIRELLGPSTVYSREPNSPINSGLIPAYAIGPEEVMAEGGRVAEEGWLGYTLIFIVNPWRPEWKTQIDIYPSMLP